MPEVSYAFRQDVFGTLSRLKKGPLEAWFLLVRLMELGNEYHLMPSKLRADLRQLVDAGVVQENGKGGFRVNPEIAFVKNEMTISEVLNETD